MGGTTFGNHVQASALANFNIMAIKDVEAKSYQCSCSNLCALIWFARFIMGWCHAGWNRTGGLMKSSVFDLCVSLVSPAGCGEVYTAGLCTTLISG
jgi:hypothetical protein